MSQFEIKCPHCGVALSIQAEWIGMILECPECKQEFSVRESPDEAPSTEQKTSGGNELNDNGQHGEFSEDNPSTEQKTSGGNEPSDDGQPSEFCEDNPPQKEKSQPIKNQAETQPVNSRKSRRLIFLVAGSLILLAAVSVSVICSLIVSSAITNGQRLLSDPNKVPDSSALIMARKRLDEVNSKYWFVFAKRRTEDLIKQLETARMAASVMDECESVLRDGQSDKFQETIDKLKQNVAKYPFPFAKLRTENLIKQLNAPVPSREVPKILKINDPAASPQLTIMKAINLANKSYLMILPLDLESEAAQISREMSYIRSYWQEYDKLHQIQNRYLEEYRLMPQDNSISSLRFRVAKLKRANQVGSEMSRPWNAAKSLHQKVDNWIQNEMRRSTTVVNGNNNTWKLSNIHGPVVLLVWEIVYFGDKFFSYQGWYRVYEPSSPETWTLN